MQFKQLKGELPDYNKSIISTYDIEYEIGMDIEAYFRIFREFDGLSQLNLNNNLYLCGSKLNDTSVGAYLLKYDANNIGSNIIFLINSKNYHYNPTLVAAKSEMIIVIGGQGGKSCEIYSTTTNKWKNLPDLPEHRFRCSAISDDATDMLYVFGGYNQDTNLNCCSVLRLNLKSNYAWDTILVKSSSELLTRNCAGILKVGNTIYILGGYNNQNNPTNEIIEYDVINRLPIISRRKLEKDSTFTQSTGVDLNKSVFYLFDEDYYVHKITRNDMGFSVIDYNRQFTDG
jgi:hypothetical protein